jgi:hypothetical protein
MIKATTLSCRDCSFCIHEGVHIANHPCSIERYSKMLAERPRLAERLEFYLFCARSSALSILPL